MDKLHIQHPDREETLCGKKFSRNVLVEWNLIAFWSKRNRCPNCEKVGLIKGILKEPAVTHCEHPLANRKRDFTACGKRMGSADCTMGFFMQRMTKESTSFCRACQKVLLSHYKGQARTMQRQVSNCWKQVDILQKACADD